MYINGNARKAEVNARTNRKDNNRIDAERRNMRDAAAAAMQEWVKTLTPHQLKQLGIR